MANEELLGADEVESAPIPADEAMGKVAQLAERHKTLSQEIESLENQVDIKAIERRQIEETLLPDLMHQIGMDSFILKDGFRITLTKMVTASISADAPPPVREAAFQWLRDNNAGDLIKRTVTLAFGKGEDDKANLLVQQAQQLFPDHVPEDKQAVHSKTLSVWVRERMDQGLPINESLLGVFVRNFAKIQPPKAPSKPRAKKA